MGRVWSIKWHQGAQNSTRLVIIASRTAQLGCVFPFGIGPKAFLRRARTATQSRGHVAVIAMINPEEAPVSNSAIVHGNVIQHPLTSHIFILGCQLTRGAADRGEGWNGRESNQIQKERDIVLAQPGP